MTPINDELFVFEHDFDLMHGFAGSSSSCCFHHASLSNFIELINKAGKPRRGNGASRLVTHTHILHSLSQTLKPIVQLSPIAEAGGSLRPEYTAGCPYRI
jgi:hypothetical protein